MITFEEVHGEGEELEEAFLNNCRAVITEEDNDYAHSAFWRDRGIGTLFFWSRYTSHLSDAGLSGTWYQGIKDSLADCGWFDLGEAIKELEEQYGEHVYRLVAVADYGWHEHIYPVTDASEAQGIFFVDSNELEREYSGDKEAALNEIDLEIRLCNAILRGEVFRVNVFDCHGELVDNLSGGGIFDLDDARDIAGDYLFEQASVCQQCDGKLQSLGVPCDCVLVAA